MPAKVKFEQVEVLREKLAKSQAVFVADYRGMTVAQMTQLRSQVRAAGGEMKVAKNTLMKIAMEQEGLVAFPEAIAYGTNIFTIAYGDPVEVSKTLSEYAKNRANKFFVLKGGILGHNTILSPEKIEALSNLPPRDILIGQVVRTIAAPISGFLTVLNGPVRGLVTCLNQIKEKKENVA